MIKKLWGYARPQRGWIAAGVLCSAAEAVFELLIPLVMASIVDVGIQNGDQSHIVKMGLLMMGMALVSLCFGLGGTVCSSVAGQGFGAALRGGVYDHIQGYAFSNIEKFTTASLVTRLTSDVNTLQMTLLMGMRFLIRSPVMLLAALVLALQISRQLSQVFLLAIPLLLLAAVLLLTRASPLFRALQEKTDALNLTVQESLLGIRVVKSFAREDHEQEKFQKRNEALRRTSERAFGLVVLNMPIMMLIVYGTIIAVMWFGGKMVYAGTLPVGDLTAFFTYITQILTSLMMVSMIFMMLTRSLACARRVVELLDEVPAIQDDGDTDPDAAVSDGRVEFRDVSFRYDAGKPWVLQDLNLTIPSGAVVGILGGTGSGKTSLVSLIPRLYQAEKGTVLVGGRPVEDYPLDALRGAVSMVLQQNTLFSGTIRENLRWGNPDATEEELWAACRAACAEEFLSALPDGLDTDLGQGGVNVSGGQKQRLCIARAILKQPKVLILDDSTSAVDMDTDAKIRRALRDELQSTTKIVIAQRVRSVMEADLILVLEEGRLVAQGDHETLLETCDIYREIYTSQQEGGSIRE